MGDEMATERESRTGWPGTIVQVGMRVRIRARGYGHHAYGTVLELDGPDRQCVVRLDRVHHTRAGFAAGNRVSIGPWWLEGEPMH